MRPETDSGRWNRLVRALRRIIGAPDYEVYLDHCRAAGHPALSEREYVKEYFDRRGRQPRCC